jgi:hypothetical protein
MKKLFCFGACCLFGWQNVSAATTSSAMAITVVVPASCYMSTSPANVGFALVNGFAGTASTNLTVGCTSGAVANVTIASLNNWRLIGSRYGGVFTYSLVYPGGGQVSGATVLPTWSNLAAGTVVLSGTATVADWVVPLNITTAIVGPTNKADTYSDTVTLSIIY